MILDKPILIVGYGSIGRRHLQNLQTLGYKNFVLYRTGKSILPDNGNATISIEYDLTKALSYKPIATIIANPTALHIPVALAAARAGSHLFLEKPVSHTLDGVEELIRLTKRKGLIVQTGFQFRFHPGLLKIKYLLETNAIGPVVSVQAHWGEHLPDWHPWEDYHKSYSARVDLGGGALLTLCHPFDYLYWLIGKINRVAAVTSRRGGLSITVEDTAEVILHFMSGAIGTVHLDFIERPTEHYLRIIGQKGVIHWDNSDGCVRLQSERGVWEKLSLPNGFDRNSLFLDELRHFLSCIMENQQPQCTLDDGVATLRIVLAAKESAQKRRFVKLR